MTNDKTNMREWSERLEAGERDDDLLGLAARLEQTRGETPAPSMEFRRQLRRDLLNQYETTAASPGRFRRLAGSLAGVGLLAALAVVTWLTMSSAGRASFGGSPSTQAAFHPTPPVTAAVVTAHSENIPEGLTPGGTLDVRVRWLIPDALTGARPFAELRDEAGQIIAQAEGQLYAGGEEQAVDFLIPLPDVLPDGNYTMVVGLYDGDGTRLPIYDSISSAVIYEYAIEQATLVEGEAAGGGAAQSPTGPVATALPPGGSRYTLLGYEVNGGIITESMQTDGGEEQTQSLLVPGMDIEVTAHWSLPVDGDEALAFVHLLDSDGAIIAQSDAPIQSGGAPDGRAKARLPFTLPADLAPGTYQLVGGLHDPASGAPLPFSVTTGQVEEYLIGEYLVSGGGEATTSDEMNKAMIELHDSESVIELRLQDGTTDMLVVREVSPASGATFSGTEPIEFVITLDYALASVEEADLDVRVTALEGNSGRGIGRAVVENVQRGVGSTTVVVTVRPQSELNGPAELGLWLQLFRVDEDGPPIYMVMPAEHRWSYVP